ncbi:hypothetical protein ACQP2U_03825 [Nocardia sp. CA-084685]|uniref:hypothetical protein n=1 Tax=Nocardia sp. CA-084685 TaxID=3239970 RepID=UPI003D959C96
MDLERAPAVVRIFQLRHDEHLAYEVIAARLNDDLDRYPPPTPNRPERATLDNYADLFDDDLDEVANRLNSARTNFATAYSLRTQGDAEVVDLRKMPS